MKIITFVKIAAIATVSAGGIASAVVFSDVNTVNTPYLRVLTKQNYLDIKKAQNDTSNIYIDYSTLPTSDVSIKDLMEQKNLGNDTNAFIFTVGSQAYRETNSILSGQDKPYSEIDRYAVSSSALMLKLYDLFYNEQSDNHEAVKDFNVSFYSFLDVLNTKEIFNADALLQERRSNLGIKQWYNVVDGKPEIGPDGKPVVNEEKKINTSFGASNVWYVKNPKENTTEQLPVVKTNNSSISSDIVFDYTPEANYYEFLPNDEYGTKYEKVYFRNQEVVSLFNNTISWANSYASAYLSGVNLNKQGCVVAAKKIDNVWSFQTFSNTSTIEEFINFYNPEYNKNSTNDSSSSSSNQ